jgi:hypothetical protein
MDLRGRSFLILLISVIHAAPHTLLPLSFSFSGFPVVTLVFTQ